MTHEEKAVENFLAGYNCAQSVFLAFAEDLGLEADFALRVEGDELEPYIERGGTALIKRGAEIRDGDVGLFFGDMVLRQYCEDWAGNVYLFAVNRRRSALDIRLPAADGAPICSFGRVLLGVDVPLPEI